MRGNDHNETLTDLIFGVLQVFRPENSLSKAAL